LFIDYFFIDFVFVSLQAIGGSSKDLPCVPEHKIAKELDEARARAPVRAQPKVGVLRDFHNRFFNTAAV
jgi:hypothetical protein